MEQGKDTKPDGKDAPADSAVSESIGVERLDILLDDPQAVYYGGQPVTGKVYLTLKSPIGAIGLRLKYKGESQVYFTDRSAGIRRKFRAEENYFHEETYLVGDGSNKTNIASGTYSFQFILPEDIPCSFEGRYGRVRYSIRAMLDVTTILRLSTNILPFTVASILNLNRDPVAPLPLRETCSKTFMGQTEPLNMSVSLPVRGYVPGQVIPVDVAVKNTSQVGVKKMRTVLKKVVSYHATEKTRKHKEIIVEIIQPIDPGIETYAIPIDVPAISPTGMIHCSIIDVRYTLKVEACVDISEWYYRLLQKNLKFRTDIVIGTVPLDHYQNPIESEEPMAAGSENFENSTIDSNQAETVKFDGRLTYERSRVYRSSKPDADDPTGDEGDSDGEVKPYLPMYRVYKFEADERKNRLAN
ncbi:arrestin domain-containing protein 2 [Cephus cinctus]|uniref:Arrestin domain-containing protein 2 n=1 Tax=Cephus cinctus TaxID=211228 RepID=A0AAJ7RSA0_CEPCN|nr:arrestin domain-containing protein 2 [Cephus cinctus]XP_024945511.1 arrestin domain-containing protein 2 [Cephus cinctus]